MAFTFRAVAAGSDVRSGAPVTGRTWLPCHEQHGLPRAATVVSGSVGRAPFREREDGRHDRPQVPAIDQPAYFDQLHPARLDDEPESASTVATLALRRSWHGDRDKPPTRAQYVPRPLPGLATDGVEDEIHIGYSFFKALRPVVDHVGGTEFPHQLSVARRGRCRHVRPAPTRKLDRERAHAARPAVDKHSLTDLEVAVVEERLPSR